MITSTTTTTTLRSLRLHQFAPAAIMELLTTAIILALGFICLAEGRNTGEAQPQQPFQLFLLSSSDTDGKNEQQRQVLPDRLMADVSYFDRLNVNSQLSNRDFVETQIRCLIYDGPCDFFGRKAKELLPSIILDNCRLCTETQKTKLSRVVVHLQQQYPGPWRDALVKYGSSPKFITAGQVAPGATFFGVVPHHKKPPHYYDQVQNGEYVGVVHFRSSTPEPTVYSFNNVNPVIPTPQTAAPDSSSSPESEEEVPVAPTAGASVKRNMARVSMSDINLLRPLMTMSSTLVAPIPVLASMSATSTSPIPEELPGVVESPPVYPTTTMSQSEFTESTMGTVLSDYDLSPSSSSSMQPPTTSVVESTIEIKPTTTEPLRSQ